MQIGGKQMDNVSENVVSNKHTVLEEENVSPTEESIVSNANSDSKPEKKSESKESLDSILRRFKRQSSGIVAEIRKREAYTKPSVKRKNKKKALRRNNGKFNPNRW